MNHALITFFGVLVVVGSCAGPALALNSATSGFWDDGATWGGTPPTGADDVVITNGCTVTIRINTAINVQSLTIQTDGVLTHSANSTLALGERYKVVLDIGNDLTIDLGGAINVDNKGYYAAGPGYQGNYWGASYGGRGTGGKGTYGSITAPTNLGSGSSSASEYGGGAAQLTVGGTTTLNGIISASELSSSTYGASGGSVFLTTGMLTGSGTIHANGRLGGGGGRVAVVLTGSTDFGDVEMQAYAGVNGGGTCGTLYQEHENHQPGMGRLIVDNNNNTISKYTYVDPAVVNTLQNGQASSSYEFSEIVLTNGAVYALDADDTLIITNTVIKGDPTDRNDGIYVAGGTLTVPATFAFTNYYIAVGTSATFNPTTSLTVGTNATMKFDVPWTVDYPITLEAGGWLSHSPNGRWTDTHKLNLTLNAGLNVQTGGAVNVDNMGYFYGGPGYGGAYYRAASYGGQGSYGVLTYGSITSPTNCGSGSAANPPERGGGSARLTVVGTTTVNGAITASDAGANTYGSSGGSVFLTTDVLAGNGIIRANGRIGGGGGRVAVVLTNSADFGAIEMQAYAGTSSGAAGTIYTETPAQGAGKGTLLIDADNEVATVTTLISSNVTDTVVGTVLIANKATFKIAADQSLTVNGSWSNAATFVAASNSTVIFASPTPTTITADNTFYNLTAGGAGKTIWFEAGKTNTVNGKLTLADYTTLLSTEDGTQWWLDLSTSTGTQDVGGVTVKDSNADLGQLILAGTGSMDLKNNVNWSFPARGSVFIVR